MQTAQGREYTDEDDYDCRWYQSRSLISVRQADPKTLEQNEQTSCVSGGVLETNFVVSRLAS
jgi:hypothetical protein